MRILGLPRLICSCVGANRCANSVLVTYSSERAIFRQRMVQTLSSLFSNDEVMFHFQIVRSYGATRILLLRWNIMACDEVFGLPSDSHSLWVTFWFGVFRGLPDKSKHVDFVKKLKPLLSAPAVERSAPFLASLNMSFALPAPASAIGLYPMHGVSDILNPFVPDLRFSWAADDGYYDVKIKGMRFFLSIGQQEIIGDIVGAGHQFLLLRKC